jgi:tRNA-dihydrouridine synthase
MVRSVVEASSLPVTAKTRCGWDNDHRNGVEVAQLLEQSGVAMVAMHARTRAQKFEGKADWSVITEAKQKVSIPLVGNGDVVSAAEAKRMLEETGCDAVMIGRGALGNPWIFRETRALLEAHDATRADAARAPGRRCCASTACRSRSRTSATLLARDPQARCVVREGLPNAAPFKERGQKVETAAALEDLVCEYIAELRGARAFRCARWLACPCRRLRRQRNGPNDDAYMADDGSAGSRVARRPGLIAMARTPAQRLIHGMTRGFDRARRCRRFVARGRAGRLADATLDHDRARRCGYRGRVRPGQDAGPDPAIAARLFEGAGRVLITRADERPRSTCVRAFRGRT